MASFIEFIIESLIGLLIFAIIVNAVLSWLVAFDVINLRHPVVRQIARFFDAVTAPVLAPFRRLIPPFGGVDVTPIIALIVLEGLKGILIPWIFSFFKPLIG